MVKYDGLDLSGAHSMCCVTTAAAQSNLRFAREANGNVSRAADNFLGSSGEGYKHQKPAPATKQPSKEPTPRPTGAFRGDPGSDRESTTRVEKAKRTKLCSILRASHYRV